MAVLVWRVLVWHYESRSSSGNTAGLTSGSGRMVPILYPGGISTSMILLASVCVLADTEGAFVEIETSVSVSDSICL